MFNLALPWWELAIRSAAIYLALIVVLRLFGKREIGQFTLFDLALILLIANAVQPAMTGSDTSLLGGLIIIATLVAVNRGIGVARARVPFIEALLESQPTILARDGSWIPAAMEHEELTVEDAEMALREHGFADVTEVRLAVLEADGSISVIPRAAIGSTPRRRRVRIVRRL
jgi:uncharacterized membrane protein YcaP (DUF421 family)